MARATAITPVLRYRDASTAARWLCEAFGFQEHYRAQALDGNVRYVSLRLGDSFVLVRPVANSLLDDHMVQPEAVSGANTQICYLTIADANDHRARAEAAGAKVELEPQDDGLGGRFYTCRDLEGHLWSFGTRTYGVAHEAASAFEPVELSPSLPSTGIASPQGRAARQPARRGRLPRDIGIAAATAVLLAGGWAYYDTYARGAAREVAAAATAARLEETADQLAQERSRRSAAEAASKQAETSLAAERSVAEELRQAVQRAQAELAGTRRKQDQAVRALEASNALSQQHRLARERAEAEAAAAKVRLGEAEAKLARLAGEDAAAAQARLAKEQQDSLKEKEELQEARAALLAANKTIEELRAGQFEPMFPEGGDPVPDNAPCVLAVQGKVASGHKGPTAWPAANLTRLCRGAEASEEPGKCFEEIMRGKVDWGAGTTWVTSNALALCGGTHSARRTIDCFKRKIASSLPWQAAIKQCRTVRR